MSLTKPMLHHLHLLYLLTSLLISLDSCLSTTSRSTDGVKIHEPRDHPMYAHVGSSLQLPCTTVSNRNDTKLLWKKEDGATITRADLRQLGWEIKATSHEPSGLIESQLIIHNISMNDRGNYVCYGIVDRSTYSEYKTWVNVVNVVANDNTLGGEARSAKLRCEISGMDTNMGQSRNRIQDPLHVKYMWIYQGNVIADYQSRESSERLQFTGTRLNDHSARSELTVSPVYKEDSGAYTCLFTLTTNRGSLNFTQTVNLDASHTLSQPLSTNSASHHSIAYHINFCLLIIIYIFH